MLCGVTPDPSEVPRARQCVLSRAQCLAILRQGPPRSSVPWCEGITGDAAPVAERGGGDADGEVHGESSEGARRERAAPKRTFFS